MNNADLYNSHEVISECCNRDDDLYGPFENAIKEMTPKELNYLSYRMGLGIADNSDWHDYFNAVFGYEWYRFNDGYHYATGAYYAG